MTKEEFISSKIKNFPESYREKAEDILSDVWEEARRDDISKISALENKLKEVIHYTRQMMDFCKDNNTIAVRYIIRWIFCLTDPEYRKQFGEDTKKILKRYGIKA